MEGFARSFPMLRSAIDMHIHASPDVTPRKLTNIQAAAGAKAAGMQAIMLKNHLTPSYACAAMAQEAVPGIRVFGGIVLNAAVGGINPVAVEAAVKMGAKCVWFPTTSSERHIQYFQQQNQAIVRVFEQSGAPCVGVMDVLALVAAADCILATGHLGAEESERLVLLAQAAGVKKIVITHPEFAAICMTVKMQKALAARGVFFERCFYASNSSQNLPVAEIARQIREVGWESTILASDFGQDFNEPPVEGLRRFLEELAQCGIPENHLAAAVTKHPAALLGL